MPKPKFQSVAYDSPPTQKLFDLRSIIDPEQFQAWNLERASLLIQSIRDAVFKKLTAAFPTKTAQLEHWLIGRNADGANGKANERIRLIPLASIGHAHADHSIRRVFIETPANCPISANDLFWAVNGVELGEGTDLSRLSASEDGTFFRHYGIGHAATDWQTITPAALPDSAKRRRIEPSRRLVEAKGASERAREQKQACVAVLAALRHAGLNLQCARYCHSSESLFRSHGARARRLRLRHAFTAKERLWHVAIKFTEPIQGPLVLGDGRFLGLGVLAPAMNS